MTTETTTAKLDSILRKVTNLLNQADHPNTGPEESATFRAKAEALMLQYRIEETQLGAADHGSAVLPTWKTVVVCEATNPYRGTYANIAYDVVSHFGCKAVSKYQDVDGTYSYTLDVCGYASDLHFIEALFTSARMAFAAKLEPKYDPEQSEQVNAYVMRMAGMEGHRIAMAIYGRDDKSLRPKVRAMFKKEAVARGEDPSILLGQGNSVKLYRESYAAGFENELWERLRNMRQARGMEASGLVLASRDENIAEAFWTKYPQFRPAPADTKAIGNERDGCPNCAKAKSGHCRQHPKPRQYVEPKVNYAAARMGATAARSVDLGEGPKGKLNV